MGKCHNCDQYDYTTHNCPIFCDVIRHTLDDIRADERAKVIEESKKIVHKVFGDILEKHEEWELDEIDELALVPNKTICKELEQLKGTE